jgi:hypothetical protein
MASNVLLSVRLYGGCGGLRLGRDGLCRVARTPGLPVAYRCIPRDIRQLPRPHEPCIYSTAANIVVNARAAKKGINRDNRWSSFLFFLFPAAIEKNGR